MHPVNRRRRRAFKIHIILILDLTSISPWSEEFFIVEVCVRVHKQQEAVWPAEAAHVVSLLLLIPGVTNTDNLFSGLTRTQSPADIQRVEGIESYHLGILLDNSHLIIRVHLKSVLFDGFIGVSLAKPRGESVEVLLVLGSFSSLTAEEGHASCSDECDDEDYY